MDTDRGDSLTSESIARLSGNAIAAVKELLKDQGPDFPGLDTLIMGRWINNKPDLQKVKLGQNQQGRFVVIEVEPYEVGQ
ncbi:hypothetical protein [Nocardia sp. NPDC005366]|uniref:hypothetical protein n=1 Tax=Nocardia sp. NPDC005366 TaxID=3156878 RepID=UPI0033B2A309